MRIMLVGGTRFVDVAVVEELLRNRHDVLVVHRGTREREDSPAVPHVHADRRDVHALREAVRAFSPDAVVDTCAYARADAATALAALGGVPAVVLSSQDVYRAFATLRAGRPATDSLPLFEDAALRGPRDRYLFAGQASGILAGVDPETYEKLDVEEVYLAAGATVLRLPMVYGERDELRREEFLLRRVRAGRGRIPVGAGNFLWSRAWVRDVAVAVRLAVETQAGAGQPLNIAEPTTKSFEHWGRDILAAAGSDAQLVRVPDALLPPDLALTGTVAQHVLVDAGLARRLLGWAASDPAQALRQSVCWHLDHAPPDEHDFAADDEALAAG